ncbi:MAG: hypothetical protein AB8B74_06150 [Crocinitomicaceae bacterium]
MRQFTSLYIFVCLFICSCSDSVSPKVTIDVYDSDTILVENDYPELVDEDVLKAIQNLNICSLSDTNTVLEPCDYKKFRVFPMGQEISSKKGFILEMKEGLYNAPVKQVLVIMKSFNKYKIINRYFGFLIEYRSTASGYNDLLIGYKDPEMGLIGIRHEWNNEKYEPVHVEEINGYFIKPELQDSVNHLFLNSFSAGY